MAPATQSAGTINSIATHSLDKDIFLSLIRHGVEQPAIISAPRSDAPRFRYTACAPKNTVAALFQRAARRTVQMAKLVRNSGRHTGGGQLALLPVG
jgi:hypothetical protein